MAHRLHSCSPRPESYPCIAALRAPDVAFLVRMTGVGVPTDQLLERQSTDILRQLGTTQEIIDRSARQQKERVVTRELPGLNHLFQPCQTGAVAEYGQIEVTFAPEALTTISDWLHELFEPHRSG